jgi:hypothetical protein
MRGKFLFLLVLLLVVTIAIPATFVRALSLTNLSDTMSTVKVSQGANHDLRFVVPGGIATGETVIYTFDTNFNLTGVADDDIDVATGDSNNCATATFTEDAVGAGNGAAQWGAVINAGAKTLTLTAPSAGTPLAADRCLRVKIGTNTVTGGNGNNQIVNPGSANSYNIAITGDFGDTGDIRVRILDDDQVSITSQVNQSLLFSISTTTIGFGALNSGAARFATNDSLGAGVETNAHTLQADTNAATGYNITFQGATLTFGGNTITPIGANNTASNPGTEQFGLRATSTGGSGAVNAPYAGAGFAYAADATTTSLLASSTAPTNTTTYSVKYLANIAGLTEAGNYTTALTYVATANY